MDGELKLRALRPGGGMEGFRDEEQCEWLGLGRGHYLSQDVTEGSMRDIGVM